MNFKAYDILSSLVPGFLALLFIISAFDMKYDKDMVVAYTAIAFLLGYLMNTISSWMEDFYFLTWGGKPSSRLLDGKDIWKVRFYTSQKVKDMLQGAVSQSGQLNLIASNDELFLHAMRYANGEKDSRVDDFNAMYAFSRSLLTTMLFGTVVLLVNNYEDWRYWSVFIPALFVIWLRCKQRAYYYAREVLNVYLKINKS